MIQLHLSQSEHVSDLPKLPPIFWQYSIHTVIALAISCSCCCCCCCIQESACSVATVILECLESDQQLSVRFFMEWLVTLLLCHHAELRESLLFPQLRMVSCVTGDGGRDGGGGGGGGHVASIK